MPGGCYAEPLRGGERGDTTALPIEMFEHVTHDAERYVSGTTAIPPEKLHVPLYDL